MKSVIDIKNCTGCTACKNNCPFQAIHMKEDEEGFLYAFIDEKKCKNCGLCEKTCPVINNEKMKNTKVKKSFAAYNKNHKERISSSSGGIFSLFAEEILSQKGVVVGCTLKNNKATHIIIDTKKDIEKLKGAKYMQSEMNDVLGEIRKILKDKKVFFTGTPCQVAGIKSYTKNHENLITCEIVCHGVPSYKTFNNYLSEKLDNNEEIIEYRFKDKKTSWKNYDVYIKTTNREITEKVHNNEYMLGYLNECYTRESCFDCKFRGEERVADITIGDFWGINYIDKSMDDDKGTSLIFINNDKGEELFNKVKRNMIYKEEDYKIAIDNNPAIISSPVINNKEKFKKIYKEKGFIVAINKTKENSIKILLKKIKNKFYRIIKK